MSINSLKTDVVVIGAGAAGLMAAISAAKRSRKVIVLESNKKLCEKIRISGGGRCNFTNLGAGPGNYISENPHFMKSALKNYTQYDFIDLVEKHRIDFYEKKLGQLFCRESSQQIIDMLLYEARELGVNIIYPCVSRKIQKIDEKKFQISAVLLDTNNNIDFFCESLVMATGGLSIPQIGASDFGYRIAKQFGLNIVEPKAALVPLMSLEKERDFYKNLSGLSIDSDVSNARERTKKSKQISFRENILFTHRGLSGPAILQVSSYIDDGDDISVDLLPERTQLATKLKEMSKNKQFSKKFLLNMLKENYSEIPVKFYDNLALAYKCNFKQNLASYSHKFFEDLELKLKSWKFTNYESEGFAKAEVTRGGIDTNELSSKSMEVKKVKNLFFVGELVDVTGWLGGYNFQWAWSSGFAAGQYC